MRSLPVILLVGATLCAACSDPDKERLKKTTVPTYDKTTGKLKELTYDFNKNGKVDTWVEMDGARAVFGKMDRDEDGKLDRWEYYDGTGKIVKVGFSRQNNGKPDAWAFPGADGKVARVEVSTSGDEKKIDRWERLEGDVVVAVDDDTDGDGKPDKWETFANGAMKTVAFDEDKDGRPDRRFTYEGGRLLMIESEPDANGRYAKELPIK